MICYSHINEENSIEQQSMDAGNFDIAYAVCGSGERVISLLGHHTLKKVIIIDTNPEALFLMELKLAALKALDIQSYLDFIGFYGKPTKTQDHFTRIILFLSDECKRYWENNVNYLDQGILNCGQFERFLNRIRPFLKFFLSKGFYNLLNPIKSEQYPFPVWRWTVIKQLFSYRFIYQVFGLNDLAFTAKDAKTSFIAHGFQQSIDEKKCHESTMLQLLFYGHVRNMDQNFMPLSFKPHFLARVKEKLLSEDISVQYLCGDFKEMLNALPDYGNQAAFYSLSDLLSFVDKKYIQNLLHLIFQSNKSKDKVILRMFIRNRLAQNELSNGQEMPWQIRDISVGERTNMYQVFEFINNKQ